MQKVSIFAYVDLPVVIWCASQVGQASPEHRLLYREGNYTHILFFSFPQSCPKKEATKLNHVYQNQNGFDCD